MATFKLKAFTILEVLVAITIISIGVLALSAGFVYIKNRNEVTHRRLQAQSFSRDIMETLLVTPYNSDPALNPGTHCQAVGTGCDFVDSSLALPSSCELSANFSAERFYSVDDSITEGKKITVTTRWTEKNGAKPEEQLFGLVIQ